MNAAEMLSKFRGLTAATTNWLLLVLVFSGDLFRKIVIC